MHKSSIWILVFINALIIGNIHAQEPFQSRIENTRAPIFYGWYNYNQAGVLSLDDGGFIVTQRLTRFNKCHNKVWCRTIDSVILNSFEFITRYINPYPFQLPYPYPKTYDNQYSLLGAFGNSMNGLAYTSDHYFISAQILPETLNRPVPVIVKLDNNGKTIWSKKLKLPAPIGKIPVYGQILCRAISKGGCVVAFTGYNSSIFDTFPIPYISISKLDKNGNIIKSNTYSGSVYNSMNSGYIENLQEMPNGGFVLFITSDLEQGVDHLIRLDSNCNFIWAEKINMSFDNNWGNGCATDSKGNIFVYRSSVGTTFYNKNIIAKIDSNGIPVWAKYIADSSTNSHILFIKGIGVGKDDRLAAIVNHYNVPTNVYPDYKNFFVRFDDLDSFSFARYLIQNLPYPFGSVHLKSTKDSGFLFTDNYFDYLKNGWDNLSLFKVDRDGKSACLGKDTSFVLRSFNLKTAPEKAASGPGFIASDTDLIVNKSNFKEKIICAPHLFPIADLGGDSVICSAKSDTLYAGVENTGAKIKWSTGDTGMFTVVKKSGTYWVRMSYGYCTSTDTATIIFKDQIKSGLEKKQFICPYDSILLQAKDTIPTYYWITPKKAIVNGRSIMARDSGNYYLMLSNTRTCAALDTVHVSYYPLPKSMAGPDTILCYNQIYTMQGAGGITYLWKPAKYLSSATDPNAKAKLPNTQLYTLIVRNKEGCQDSSKVLLTVKPKLEIKAKASSDSVCYGQKISLYAIAKGGDSLHYKYYWPDDNLAGNAISITAGKSGWHKVKLTDNCSPDQASDSIYIAVSPPAEAAFSFIPGNPVKMKHPVNFQNRSQNSNSWLWTFDPQDSSRVKSPVYMYTDTGNYKVMLIAYGLNGCANDTTYGDIKVIDGTVTIYIPNIFTPNEDGKNDYFEIKGTGIKEFNYSIYNRWGELIFEGSALNQGIPGQARNDGKSSWDGTFKGAQVPEGVYIYTVAVKDVFGGMHYLNGNVTISR
jgi:gliding motility-associated-like protein